jgi:hypothetical protein
MVAVAAILFISMTGTAARATEVDTTPPATEVDTTAPTAPYIVYASGLLWTGECQTVTIGLSRSTDDVTPQQDLTYEVFADGTLIGTVIEYTGAYYNGLWATLLLPKAGLNAITAKAFDAAGNRSAPSNAQVVTGYAC